MADRQETVTITTKSDLPDAFKSAEKGADDLGKSIKDVGAESKTSATATEGFTDKLNKAKVAFTALKAVVLDTITAFAEQDALLGQLSTSYERFTGGTAEDVERGLEKITENSIKYGVAVNDQIEALKNLAQASGDAKTAEEDLALAIDISAQENIALAASSKLLAKARLGDVAAIKSLGAFNKDFIKDLSKVTDESERSRLAIQALNEKYKGLADANKGLADDMAGAEGAGMALAVAIGSIATEFGGFLARLVEMLPFMNDGELAIGNITRAFTNFATAIKNTGTGIKEFAAGLVELGPGGILGIVEFGRPDKFVKSARIAGRKTAEAFKEGAEEAPKVDAAAIFGPAFDAEQEVRTKNLIAAEKKAKEKAAAEAAKAEAAKEKAAAAASSKREAERAKAAAEEAKAIAAARKKFADDQKAQEAVDFRERQARLILEGEERLALQERLEGADATESETELALKAFDDTREKLEKELEVREQIAELKREGKDLEAETLKITSSNLSVTEKSNALDALSAKTSKAKAAANLEAAQATKAGVVGILALAGEEEAAKRAGAALDGLIYQYQAIGEFALGNIPAGVQFQVAAISAFAVAGTSSGGGGGGSKGAGSASKSPAGTAQRSASTDAQRTAGGTDSSSTVTYVLNLRSLSKPTRQEAREFLDATERERRSRLG